MTGEGLLKIALIQQQPYGFRRVSELTGGGNVHISFQCVCTRARKKNNHVGWRGRTLCDY